MARIRYYYNTETCDYERAKKGRSTIVSFAFPSICCMVFIGLGVLILYENSYFQTPDELTLSRQIKGLELKYDKLNKDVDLINEVLDKIEHRDDNVYRIVLGAEPIEKSVRDAGIGGADRYADIRKKNAEHSALIIALHEKLDRARRKLYIESKSQDELVQFAEEREKLHAAIPAIQPVANKDLKAMSSSFGSRMHPIHKVKKKHAGIDFSAKIGTPVYATADGTVMKAEAKFTGYGKSLEIDHGFGYRTRYAHMKGFAVKKGQAVKRGDLIGYVGNTGLSTGPHLHYEVFVNDVAVDPRRYFFSGLTAAEYENIIELATYHKSLATMIR
jgi:murein DD-endopeptidase MepM/ murein hydrolase activator NlpD